MYIKTICKKPKTYRGGFFTCFEVVQNWHASRGRTHCTIRGRFGNCAKKGIRSPVSEIYRVYTQKSQFFARIPDPSSVFSFRHPDRKVLTESSRYTGRYPCSYLKVSEFHLAVVVEVCYCIWQTEIRSHFVSIWILNLSTFPFGKWPGDVARGSGELRYQFLFMDGFLTCWCDNFLDVCSLILHYKDG